MVNWYIGIKKIIKVAIYLFLSNNFFANRDHILGLK